MGKRIIDRESGGIYRQQRIFQLGEVFYSIAYRNDKKYVFAIFKKEVK